MCHYSVNISLCIIMVRGPCLPGPSNPPPTISSDKELALAGTLPFCASRLHANSLITCFPKNSHKKNAFGCSLQTRHMGKMVNGLHLYSCFLTSLPLNALTNTAYHSPIHAHIHTHDGSVHHERRRVCFTAEDWGKINQPPCDFSCAGWAPGDGETVT